MEKSNAQKRKSTLKVKYRAAQKVLFNAEIELKDLGLNFNSVYAKSKYWREKYNLWKKPQVPRKGKTEQEEERNVLFFLNKYDTELETIRSKRKEIKRLKKAVRRAWEVFLENDEING